VSGGGREQTNKTQRSKTLKVRPYTRLGNARCGVSDNPHRDVRFPDLERPFPDWDRRICELPKGGRSSAIRPALIGNLSFFLGRGANPAKMATAKGRQTSPSIPPVSPSSPMQTHPHVLPTLQILLVPFDFAVFSRFGRILVLHSRGQPKFKGFRGGGKREGGGRRAKPAPGEVRVSGIVFGKG
jgi:hypothetical protein